MCLYVFLYVLILILSWVRLSKDLGVPHRIKVLAGAKNDGKHLWKYINKYRQPGLKIRQLYHKTMILTRMNILETGEI